MWRRDRVCSKAVWRAPFDGAKRRVRRGRWTSGTGCERCNAARDSV